MSNKNKIKSDMVRIIARVVTLEMKDPLLKFVTITDLDLKPDLSSAIVYYTLYSEKHSLEKIHQILIKATSYIKTYLSKAMNIRKIPNLIFVYDTSLEYGNKINKLLAEMKKKQ